MVPEEVLQFAVKTYWREGPEVSVNTICRRAGLSKPSLYREFGSEDGLIAAALEHYAAMVQGRLRDLLSCDLDFDRKLEALVAYASEDRSSEHGCLFVKMRAAQRQLGPRSRKKVKQIEAANLRLYERFFRQSRENGEWPGRLTPEFAARYLHAQIGLAVSQRALGAKPATVKPLMACALSVLTR
jgi:AcrR family transcriptional regulator